MFQFRLLCAVMALIALVGCGGTSSVPSSDLANEDGVELPVASPPPCQCNDGIDNDRDGLVDWPADPGCSSPTSNSEVDLPMLAVEFVSSSASVIFQADTLGEGDVARFVIKYDVTAIGSDIYIDGTCTGGGDALFAPDGNIFEIGGDALIFSELTVDGDSMSESFLVEQGSTVEFKLTVIAEARSDGLARLILEAIGWSEWAGEGDQLLELPLGEFETPPIALNFMSSADFGYGSSDDGDYSSDSGYQGYDDADYSADYIVPTPTGPKG